jgi:hypothetical protein
VNQGVVAVPDVPAIGVMEDADRDEEEEPSEEDELCQQVDAKYEKRLGAH